MRTEDEYFGMPAELEVFDTKEYHHIADGRHFSTQRTVHNLYRPSKEKERQAPTVQSVYVHMCTVL